MNKTINQLDKHQSSQHLAAPRIMMNGILFNNLVMKSLLTVTGMSTLAPIDLMISVPRIAR